MKSAVRPTLFLVLGIALAVAFGWHSRGTAEDAKAGPVGAARYTVISTDGAHLIVTDNGANKLYFYAIDRDGKIGDELKLRGSADLTEVGKPSIKPIDAKPQK